MDNIIANSKLFKMSKSA